MLWGTLQSCLIVGRKCLYSVLLLEAFGVQTCSYKKCIWQALVAHVIGSGFVLSVLFLSCVLFVLLSTFITSTPTHWVLIFKTLFASLNSVKE